MTGSSPSKQVLRIQLSLQLRRSPDASKASHGHGLKSAPHHGRRVASRKASLDARLVERRLDLDIARRHRF
ncbi:hypothetical protein NM208_g10689 [Fusarium decemcellulare]|uniref:Uncharacterized protein n=1 Tax=Fusarium decemcellulare TaxID=57161 RepID=A0ACC1RX25_9HYPO|nr:hypothetical protein NM208_g10689 [Fusarium decemcellulare]